MALNTADLMEHTFANVAKAEDFAMAAWAGAVTTALSVGHFGNGSISEKVARQGLAARAGQLEINVNTWQAYVGAMFKAADKLVAMAQTLPDFQSLHEAGTEDACALVELWLRSLNMSTGSHIRDWTKQDGLEPYNPNAAKEKRDAKARQGSLDALALMQANRAGPAGGTVSDTATAPAPVNPLDAVLAAIATLNSADAAKAMEALNAHMVALDAKVAAHNATPKAKRVAPVVADDAATAPGSVQAKQADRVAMADKLASLGRVKAA